MKSLSAFAIYLLLGVFVVLTALTAASPVGAVAPGSLKSWGQNTGGQLGNGTTTQSSSPVQVAGLDDVIAIAGGDNHSLAVKSDGTVWSWGNNYYGQLGVSGGGYTTALQVTSITGVAAVAAGRYHSLALKTTGIYLSIQSRRDR